MKSNVGTFQSFTKGLQLSDVDPKILECTSQTAAMHGRILKETNGNLVSKCAEVQSKPSIQSLIDAIERYEESSSRTMNQIKEIVSLNGD